MRPWYWGMAYEHECPGKITCRIWNCNSLLAGGTRGDHLRPRHDPQRQRLVSPHADAGLQPEVRGFLRVHVADRRIYHRLDVALRPGGEPDSGRHGETDAL